MSSKSELEQHALSTQRWGPQQRAHEKRTLALESFTFRPKHDHEHTPASEDDLLQNLGMPEDTQTWTRFDKTAKTYCTTSSAGPLWEIVMARITIDDKTGLVMSLDYTKHMKEKDVYRNLPSVRDIRTLLLH